MLSLKHFITTLKHNSNSSRFKKNFFSILKANIIAGALPILSAPIIARLFSPDEFGIYTLFVSVVAFFSFIVILRVDWSVPNTVNQQRASELIVLGLIILSAIILLFLGITYLYNIKDIDSELVKSLKPYIWLLPLAVVGMAIQHLLKAWYVREAKLQPVSRSKILQSFVNTTGQISFGIGHFGVMGLLFSHVISIWLSMIFLSSSIKETLGRMKRISFKKLSVTFRKFRKESLSSTLVSSVNAASLASLPILVVIFYKPEELGWYGLMHRLAVAPMALFTTAISQSFWAEAAKVIKTDSGKLRHLYIQTTKKLILITVPLIIVWMAAPFYIAPIFGSNWEPAAFVLMALVPMLAAQMVVSPLSHLIVHRKQHWQLIWDICRCLGIISIFLYMGVAGHSFIIAILSVSVIHMIFYTLLFFLNLRAFHNGN